MADRIISKRIWDEIDSSVFRAPAAHGARREHEYADRCDGELLVHGPQTDPEAIPGYPLW
jgi:hypothetical protein